MQTIPAQYHPTLSHVSGQPRKEDTATPEDAESLYQKAVEQRSSEPAAQYDGVIKTIALFKAAADLGHAGAMAQLVLIYTGLSEHTNYDEAIRYKGMAASSLTDMQDNAQLILDVLSLGLPDACHGENKSADLINELSTVCTAYWHKILNTLSPVLSQSCHGENWSADLINELSTVCRAYQHNQNEVINKLPRETWSQIMAHLPGNDRRNLARTSRMLDCIEASANRPSEITLKLSRLNGLEFRQYLQRLSGVKLTIKIKWDSERGWDGKMRQWDSELGWDGKTRLQTMCEALGKNKRIRGIKLDLSYTPVTDAGLEPLAGLTQLHTLDLSFTKVTDAGLEHLAGLTQLHTLDLRKTRVTDAGLVRLAGLTQLHSLVLSFTKVTDAGLLHLAGLTQLQSLDLSRTKVTDAGLVHLAGLTQLQSLSLYGTQVTAAGRQYLAESNGKIQLSF